MQPVRVKPAEEPACYGGADRPETDQQVLGSGKLERPRESPIAFIAGEIAEAGLAGAERDQLDAMKIEPGDLRTAEEPVLPSRFWLTCCPVSIDAGKGKSAAQEGIGVGGEEAGRKR